MNPGWISIQRTLMYTDFWLSESFTRGQAWVDLILLANHQKGFIRVRGNLIPLERGDVGWSKVKLAVRWKWSRGKTERFLNELKMNERIDIKQNNRISTVLSIKNYDLYQPKGHQTIHQTEHQTDIRQDTNKNDKNVKNDRVATKVAPPNSEVQEIVQYLEKRLEVRFPNFVKQAKAWKLMNTAGYTKGQILAAIDDMLEDPFYSDKGFDLMTVLNQIPKIKAKYINETRRTR